MTVPVATPVHPGHDLSAFAFLQVVMAGFFGPDLARFASAYLLIVLGWLFGMLVGSLRLPVRAGGRSQPRRPLAILALTSFFAVFVLSVPLADALHAFIGTTWPSSGLGDARNLIAPLAFAIPAVGHSWLDIGRWAWARTPFSRGSTGSSSENTP